MGENWVKNKKGEASNIRLVVKLHVLNKGIFEWS